MKPKLTNRVERRMADLIQAEVKEVCWGISDHDEREACEQAARRIMVYLVNREQRIGYEQRKQKAKK